MCPSAIRRVATRCRRSRSDGCSSRSSARPSSGPWRSPDAAVGIKGLTPRNATRAAIHRRMGVIGGTSLPTRRARRVASWEARMAHWSGRARRRAPLLLALTLVAASFAAGPSAALAAGSIELTALDVAYTQDFDTLTAAPDGGTSEVLPNGWWLSEAGTNANTSYGVGTGSSNSGNTYSFGAAGSTERAFGEPVERFPVVAHRCPADEQHGSDDHVARDQLHGRAVAARPEHGRPGRGPAATSSSAPTPARSRRAPGPATTRSTSRARSSRAPSARLNGNDAGQPCRADARDR